MANLQMHKHRLNAASGCTAWQQVALGRFRSPCSAVPRQFIQPRGAPAHLAGRPYETAEERAERQARESDEVEERVTWISGIEHLKTHLRAAGDKLVLLELQSDTVCDAGFFDKPELHWKLDQEKYREKSLEACRNIKHTFQRTARDCPDVLFFSMQVSDDYEGEQVKRALGVEIVPALQFYRNGELLYSQQGFTGMEKEMGEGVLYYSGAAAGGAKAQDHVTDLTSKAALKNFINQQDKDLLTVLDVSTTLCKPCIKVFPAVLALAQNFAGHATFGRLIGDESDETEQLMHELNILEVPTFIFYRGGKELGRHVGSSRGDLIGNILQYQAAAGIAPPPPPPREPATAKPRPAPRQRSRW